MTIQEQWLEVQGLRIHSYVSGDQGSPVVLLHGGGVDSAWLSWEWLMPELASCHRVFAADWPGFGDSEKPPVKPSMEYYLQFLNALMQAWGLEHVDLVGLSMGGGIALGTVLSSPQRVRRLVLLDSYGLQDKAVMHAMSYLLIKMPWLNEWSWKLICSSRSMVRASLKSLLRNPQALTASLVDRALIEAQKPHAGKAWQVFQESEMQWQGTRTCYMERLSTIMIPTLIVHGKQDQAVPLKFAQQAHERIKNSQLEILDGCGHWPQRDQPEQVNRIVSAFLAD